MFDLPHVASRLYGTPLLVARPKLEVILQALGPRLASGEASPLPDESPRKRPPLRITEAGIAVLPILGTLVRRSSYLAAQSGLTSYHDIEADAQEAFTNPAVRGVLLEIDSCGGEAGGLLDLADSLRNMAELTGKPLWAVADEAALSAAYALACAAEHIVVTRTAEIGSVGVVALHVDESGADAQAGLAYTYIHAGAHKLDANPHAPLSDDVKSALQADVDELYTQFVHLVATRRGCSAEAVRATEAAVFRGQHAVNAGLADAVGTLQQAHDGLAASLDKVALAAGSGPNAAGMPEAPEAPETAETSKPAVPAPEPLQARLDALSSIVAQAERLGVAVDPLAALRRNISPDALRRQVLQQAAERDATEDVVSTAAAHSSAQPQNPLLAAVRTLFGKGANQ